MTNCNCPRSSYGIKHTPECYDALAAELVAAKRQDELHWRTRKSYLDHIAKLEAALRGLLPLAEWALLETSPPCIDQPLVDAAHAALACFTPETSGVK